MFILYFFIVLNTIKIYFKLINFIFNNIIIKYIINKSKCLITAPITLAVLTPDYKVLTN
jgi:hypothetical protein